MEYVLISLDIPLVLCYPIPNTISAKRRLDMEQITVNFANITGKIKPMHSVNNGPAGARVRGTSNFDLFLCG